MYVYYVFEKKYVKLEILNRKIKIGKYYFIMGEFAKLNNCK